jgi:hypothetical protein
MTPAVPVEIPASVTEKARSDDRFSAGRIEEAARLAIDAWAAAADGDENALAALGEWHTVETLLRPPWKSWRLAAGVHVTEVYVWDLEPADPVRLRLRFQFTGHRVGRVSDGETDFVGLLDLTLAGTGPRPWRLSAGQVSTLDEYLGYTFVSRPETPEEQRERVGSGTSPATGQPGRWFRLTAGFAEHDERFGSTASVEVRLESPPPRDEAEQLIRPAIWAVTAGALGDGDWNPVLNWLDVIELLGD